MSIPEPAIETSVSSEEAPSQRNILKSLLDHAAEPARTALKHKAAGQWREMTWQELLERVRLLSEALVANDIQPGDRVCIYAATRLEWTLADLAILGAGAITVPIYPSNTPEEVEHILTQTEAKLVFFDEDSAGSSARHDQLQKLRSSLPNLTRLVPMVPEQFDAFAREGASRLALSPHALEARTARLKPDDLSSIIFTSGTTGMPKGVMLTHGNWSHTAWAVEQVDVLAVRDTILLFLPLAHVFARIAEMAWLRMGSVVVFAESIEKAVDSLAETHATVLPCVPRVLEKVYAKVMEEGTRKRGLEGFVFRWSMKVFDEFVTAEEEGRAAPLLWPVARRLVFSKIGATLAKKFGGRLRLAVSGGAPLSSKIARFFDQCGIPIVEGYGLTETCAPTHANRVGQNRPGVVGYPLPGLEAMIAPDGELLLRGPQVTKGYWRLPEETAAAFNEEGWFKTGDVGEITNDGALRITDRKKDLIKTSGGKYIAPQALELALKSEPLISQSAVLGDRRNFVSALITISEENLQKWANDAKIATREYKRLVNLPEVRARIQTAIDVVNQGLPRYATIKKFAILERDWSTLTGELTPKLSVRRKVIERKFKQIIDDIYGAEALH